MPPDLRGIRLVRYEKSVTALKWGKTICPCSMVLPDVRSPLERCAETCVSFCISSCFVFFLSSRTTCLLFRSMPFFDLEKNITSSVSGGLIDKEHTSRIENTSTRPTSVRSHSSHTHVPDAHDANYTPFPNNWARVRSAVQYLIRMSCVDFNF